MSRPRVRAAMAVATVGSFALLAGCTATTDIPEPTSSAGGSTSPTTSAPVPSAPVSGAETSAPGMEVDWGSFPPKNLDEAKDLSDPQFPEQVSTFELESVSGGEISMDSFYLDPAAGVSMTAGVSLGFTSYDVIVSEWSDPAYQGDAVCGHPSESPNQGVCLMVGKEHILRVGTAAEVPIEDVAAFAEEIYDLL